jgi:Protein of unknown function (DUF4239)
MLNIWQSTIIVVLAVSCSMLFMWTLNRIWPWDKRHAHNDLIGWQLSILGTTYAVILGFMLYAVWNNFGEANVNVDNEANALSNLYRLAQGLPDPQRGQIEALATSYADTAINQDWPQMEAGQTPETTHKINQDMWKTLMSIKNGSPTELAAEDHALSELSALTEQRRIRLLQNAFRLPTVLWSLLVVGGAITIASSAMFGSANTTLHALQVFAFSLLISLTLVAVADIDRPFQGSVHVSDFAFQRALRAMQH